MKCHVCKREIKATESHWRDHKGRLFCNDCDARMRGKHDK